MAADLLCYLVDSGGHIAQRNNFVRIACLIAEYRRLMAVSVLGLLASASGCGGSVGGSSATPETPPPGLSGQEQAEAIKKAYGPTGKPKATKSAARFKTF